MADFYALGKVAGQAAPNFEPAHEVVVKYGLPHNNKGGPGEKFGVIRAEAKDFASMVDSLCSCNSHAAEETLFLELSLRCRGVLPVVTVERGETVLRWKADDLLTAAYAYLMACLLDDTKYFRLCVHEPCGGFFITDTPARKYCGDACAAAAAEDKRRLRVGRAREEVARALEERVRREEAQKRRREERARQQDIQRRQREQDERQRLLSEGKKRCPGCKKIKPLEEFYPDKNRPVGYGTRCKDCTRAYNRRYYQGKKQNRVSRDKRRPNHAAGRNS